MEVSSIETSGVKSVSCRDPGSHCSKKNPSVISTAEQDNGIQTDKGIGYLGLRAHFRCFIPAEYDLLLSHTRCVPTAQAHRPPLSIGEKGAV